MSDLKNTKISLIVELPVDALQKLGGKGALAKVIVRAIFDQEVSISTRSQPAGWGFAEVKGPMC